MPITVPPQPEAGLFIKVQREQELGLRAQDFCDLVSREETLWGRVNLDRNGLYRIEAFGIVPLPPRRWAIAAVLGLKPGEIWHTPGSRFAPTTRRAAR